MKHHAPETHTIHSLDVFIFKSSSKVRTQGHISRYSQTSIVRSAGDRRSSYELSLVGIFEICSFRYIQFSVL